jgi:hypothetical protein
MAAMTAPSTMALGSRAVAGKRVAARKTAAPTRAVNTTTYAGERQGLTIVHSAQPKPCLTQRHSLHNP